MSGAILVLNRGSSSVKCALFEAGPAVWPPRPLWRGKRALPAHETHAATAHDAALQELAAQALAHGDGHTLSAVAHRIVHGGPKYVASTRIDRAVLADLRGYAPLAPLHQEPALELVDSATTAFPGIPQVACFDTAFHDTLPEVEKLLPIPYSEYLHGVRRYGFHGLSYDYLSVALPRRHGDAARGRTLVAHLGSGASLCAMQRLRSVATTMGFSPLDGLMMGTRCGALDPGVVLYLMESGGLSVGQARDLLYRKSGLLGVSGTSDDVRDLLARESRDQRAQLALGLYMRRLLHEAGALVAVMGGLDMLAFSGGVGEHAAPIRARLCQGLSYCGVELDVAANERADSVVSTAGSQVRVVVEPTDEEWVAARDAAALTGSGRAPGSARPT